MALLLFVSLSSVSVGGFAFSTKRHPVPTFVTATKPSLSSSRISPLFSNSNENDEDKTVGTTSARDLGFDAPSQRSTLREQPNVRVDLVDDVDSVTLTAVGFGLIALNFLVLANLGDGGIGGVVATIINTLKD